MAVRIDASAHSAVAVCTLCTWRDVAASPRSVWPFALAHTTAVHGYDQRAHDAAYRARQRAAAVVA